MDCAALEYFEEKEGYNDDDDDDNNNDKEEGNNPQHSPSRVVDGLYDTVKDFLDNIN